MIFGKNKQETVKNYQIASEHILEVKDLHVHIDVDEYKLHAVRGVNFALRKGETLGLVGESGCGKSVTSKEILGINPDNCSSEGQILYRTKEGNVLNLLELDRDGETYRAIRGAEISMIFQEPMTSFSPLYYDVNKIPNFKCQKFDFSSKSINLKDLFIKRSDSMKMNNFGQ